MACLSRTIHQIVTRSSSIPIRQFHHLRMNHSGTLAFYQIFGILAGTSIAVYAAYSEGYLKSQKTKNQKSPVKLTSRKKRFIKFASIQYDGQLYMTPQNFLESVLENEPRLRPRMRLLSENDLNSMLMAMPTKSTSTMFKDLGNNGIISYAEYIFLLSILTKPKSTIRIIFNLFDMDGNKKIDKNEFLVIEKVYNSVRRSKWGMIVDKSNGSTTEKECVHDLQRQYDIDTTLTVYFFGTKGDKKLKFKDFHNFIVNLQSEVLELEFLEFSKGLSTISELNFAEILLRRIYVRRDFYDLYLERVSNRLKVTKGVTLKEFLTFSQFLNSMEDFSAIIKMYALANRPISKAEFCRAVEICTGTTLSAHLVDVLFAIFDVDEDGMLRYEDFIAVRKNRFHRGSKAAHTDSWTAFKSCIKYEMRRS